MCFLFSILPPILDPPHIDLLQTIGGILFFQQIFTFFEKKFKKLWKKNF